MAANVQFLAGLLMVLFGLATLASLVGFSLAERRTAEKEAIILAMVFGILTAISARVVFS